MFYFHSKIDPPLRHDCRKHPLICEVAVFTLYQFFVRFAFAIPVFANSVFVTIS